MSNGYERWHYGTGLEPGLNALNLAVRPAPGRSHPRGLLP